MFVDSKPFFLSSPGYEQYINEGIELPPLVCVITGKSLFALQFFQCGYRRLHFHLCSELTLPLVRARRNCCLYVWL